MHAFLFSGQGSQKEGMAEECLKLGQKAVHVYTVMSDVSGKEIATFSEDELKTTTGTQLAVVAYSLALWESLGEEVKTDAVLAGFSLGEYTALAAADVLSLEDLTKLILVRSKAMEEAATTGESLGMAAVLGLQSEDVEAVLADWNGEPVYAVNYNSPTQTVISGNKDAIDILSARMREKGAKRVLPLAVAGAFHSPYVEAAAAAVFHFAKELTFKAPRYPLYSNLDGNLLNVDANFDWASYLRETIISPVRFVEELRQLRARGITSYIECGPGKTLQGLVKQTLENVETKSAHALITADSGMN